MKLTKQLNQLLNNLNSMYWFKRISLDYNVYIIGGCVRDGFLNKPIKDIDIVVENIKIDRLIELLKEFGKVDLVGESFSVIKFKPYGYHGEYFDIAVPRVDRKISEGHKGFDVITENVRILDDLARRDLTINSIAINILTKELLDPFNGLKDLKNKIIRATDTTAFIEDPLRLCRVIQFSSRFDFNVEPITKNLMKNNAHLIDEISGERILEEFEKIINKHGKISTAMQLMYDTILDFHLFKHKFFNITNFRKFDGLDKLSFYFLILGWANVIPSKFYSERLKGNSEMTKALSILMNIHDFEADKYKNRESFNRFFIMKMIRNSPMILTSKWFLEREGKIIKLMKSGKIPMYFGDVKFTGDDIIKLNPNLKGEEIGNLYDRMYMDATINMFNWKNRQCCLDYLMKLM